MDYTVTNNNVFNWLLSMNPSFSELSFNDGILNYNGAKVNLVNFDLRKVFSGNSMLNHDLEQLDAFDIFSIINIHVAEDTILKFEPEFYNIINEG